MLEEAFKRGNTAVVIKEAADDEQDRAHLELFGNVIAKRKGDGSIVITDAGWPTATTRERLSGLPGVTVARKGGEQMLNGEQWDGKWVKVC